GGPAPRHPPAVPGGVRDPLLLRGAPRDRRRLSLRPRPVARPRQHHVRGFLGPRAPLGGDPRRGRLHRGGPRGRDLPGEPRRRARSRGRAPERVMKPPAFLRRFAERHPTTFALWEAVGMGFAALRAYKMRAALTILGVVMGIMTVTGMSAIVAGLNDSMA